MFKKTIFYLLIFVAVGEIMIRIDDRFRFFTDNRVVKIGTGVATTPEFKLLNENKIDLSNKSLRVLVIGDSYIAGGGIELKDRFSRQLNILLNKKSGGFNQIYVLDVSRPSSNNLDNNQSYFYYINRFKPDVVILGYNLNDVEGNLEKQIAKNEIAENHISTTNSSLNRSFSKKIYSLYKNSKFLDFTLHKLHEEMKAHGKVVPNSVFDLMLKSYSLNKENWVASKNLLNEVIADANEKKIHLCILKFPEINLLEYPELFTESDKVIKDYFTQFQSIDYINGTELFKGKDSKDYILSKYDGHPNEKAHKEMAIAVSNIVLRGLSQSDNNNTAQ
jgi:lysophospholipase L1-like esterase